MALSSAEAVLERRAIRLEERAGDKWEVLRRSGELLAEIGAVEPAYADSVLERERLVTTYLGEGVAIPHGTGESRPLVRRTALGFLRFPGGVDWDGETCYLAIPIAAAGDEHVALLSALAEVLADPDRAAALRAADDPDTVLALLGPAAPGPEARGTELPGGPL